MIATHILHFLPAQVLSVLLVEHGRIEVLRVDLEYAVETTAFANSHSHTKWCGVSSSRWTQMRKDGVVSLLEEEGLQMMIYFVSTMAAACCFARHSGEHVYTCTHRCDWWHGRGEGRERAVRG